MQRRKTSRYEKPLAVRPQSLGFNHPAPGYITTANAGIDMRVRPIIVAHQA